MAKGHNRSLQQELKAVLEKTANQSSPDIFQIALDLRKKLRKKAVRFTDSAKLLREGAGSSCVVTKETPEKAMMTKRRSRALLALDKMQKKSLKSGLNNLTDSQVQSEIRAVRKARR
jgi:hypothetical protein